ncbi:MAG TPA: M23 family metallopeptidase [Candidatus Methylomirabilis sp.]|nr:M23 family metallopeptidase [Candidatus Methylomirabilis sp.]
MPRILPVVLLMACSVALSAAEPAVISRVSWQPQIMVNGSVCLFTVEVKGSPQKVTAKWLGRDLTFSPGAGSTWFSLAGVAYETKPGTYDLALEAVMRDGHVLRATKPVTVRAAKYKTSRLTVPQKYVTPDPETLKRIEAEKEIKNAAFAHFIPSPDWAGNFVAPVPMEVSENYGTSRTFNGKLASVHRGTDFRAPLGTPVHASNAGEVVLARELYYEGNCIVIDHGLGFMTMYMHLSQFDVKEGDKVEKGRTIALSGGTGRVTGPHLHMSVRWNGEYLDAMKLLALRLP